jgi:hypothetical protein
VVYVPVRVIPISRIALGVGVATAIVLASCSTAIGSRSGSRLLRLHPIAVAKTPILTDRRWAVYQRNAKSFVLIDSRSGRRVERATPSGCASSLSALGGNELLFTCAGPTCSATCDEGNWSLRAVIENAATGAVSEITRLPFRGRPGPVLTGIGEQWIEVGEFEYKVTHRYFINWRTGEVRDPTEASDTYVDLDGSSPMRHYCAPLSRLSASVGGPAPNAFGGFGAEIAFRYPFAIESYAGAQVLSRCGTQSEQRLPRTESLDPTITAGIASWGQFVTRLHAHGHRWHGPVYGLKTFASSRFPAVEPGASKTVANTATTIYISRPLPYDPQPRANASGWEIYAVGMP